MKMLAAWVKAARIQSQLYIFLPLLFGQAYAIILGTEVNYSILYQIIFWGVFIQLYIVFANDYADIEADRINTTYTIFSGGSRVLVDGDLPQSSLKHGAIMMASLTMLSAFGLALYYHRWWAIPISFIALLLLWLYSYNPVKLSYRGGGELLQMVGVGLVLPFFGFYCQTGTIARFPWHLLISILPMQLACAMATSLPDEPSDRHAGKKTASVLFGIFRTNLLIIGLNIISVLTLSFTGGILISDYRYLIIIIGPIISIIMQMPLIRSKPGTKELARFVFLAVFTTLYFMASMTAILLITKGHG
jgi:1,4-dihydroxy-2-naphthoate octaprenyltransferase